MAVSSSPPGEVAVGATDDRPRTIVTADPELDDLNSMIRLLSYANEVRIEGLVYASSRFHWRGDGRGTTFFLPDREYDEPRTSWRWAAGERFIDDVVDAYERVWANLVVHDPRYPAPAALRAVVREGNVDFEGEMSRDTPGSELIAAALLDDDPSPVHVQVWAGTSTLARALRSIEERFAATPEWAGVRAAVSRKTIVTKFASQDDTYDDYLRPVWPDIRVTDVAVDAWGYFARRVHSAPATELLGAAWLRENVTSAGPLGALYRVWGDGRQLVPGDVTDFFGERARTADELRADGYRVWIDPQAPGEWVSEGDTPNMLNLIAPGLRGWRHPSFGGWGGRAVRTADGPDTWALRGAEDAAADGSRPREHPVTRWFADAQRDFAARLRWSTTPRFADANHPPELRVLPGEDLDVRPGESVELVAAARDPDGDAVACRWWVYAEAGTYPGAVEPAHADGERMRVRVPADARAGQTVHVVVEAVDSASQPLKAYRRVVLTVAEAAP